MFNYDGSVSYQQNETAKKRRGGKKTKKQKQTPAKKNSDIGSLLQATASLNNISEEDLKMHIENLSENQFEDTFKYVDPLG